MGRSLIVWDQKVTPHSHAKQHDNKKVAQEIGKVLAKFVTIILKLRQVLVEV